MDGDGACVLNNGSGLYKAYYTNEKSVGNGFVPYHPEKESLFPSVHCIWKQPPGNLSKYKKVQNQLVLTDHQVRLQTS